MEITTSSYGDFQPLLEGGFHPAAGGDHSLIPLHTGSAADSCVFLSKGAEPHPAANEAGLGMQGRILSMGLAGAPLAPTLSRTPAQQPPWSIRAPIPVTKPAAPSWHRAGCAEVGDLRSGDMDQEVPATAPAGTPLGACWEWLRSQAGCSGCPHLVQFVQHS